MLEIAGLATNGATISCLGHVPAYLALVTF